MSRLVYLMEFLSIRSHSTTASRGGFLLVNLHDHGSLTWDIEDVQPDPELTTLVAPCIDNPFFRREGLTRPGRAAHYRRHRRGLYVEPTHDGGFGWPLMITDVMAIVDVAWESPVREL